MKVEDRFDGPTKTPIPDPTGPNLSDKTKPSIVVLPFQLIGSTTDNSVIADAIPHDLIQALSQLRWLFVIARGTASQFRSRDLDVRETGKILGVRYSLVGTVEIAEQTISISIELSDTHDGGVVWGEQFKSPIDLLQKSGESLLTRV